MLQVVERLHTRRPQALNGVARWDVGALRPTVAGERQRGTGLTQAAVRGLALESELPITRMENGMRLGAIDSGVVIGVDLERNIEGRFVQRPARIGGTEIRQQPVNRQVPDAEFVGGGESARGVAVIDNYLFEHATGRNCQCDAGIRVRTGDNRTART